MTAMRHGGFYMEHWRILRISVMVACLGLVTIRNTYGQAQITCSATLNVRESSDSDNIIDVTVSCNGSRVTPPPGRPDNNPLVKRFLECLEPLMSAGRVKLNSNMMECVNRVRNADYVCELSIGQSGMGDLSSYLSENCKLDRFYSIVNKYDHTNCAKSPGGEVFEFLSDTDNGPFNDMFWHKVDNVAVLCLVPVTMCADDIFKTRIKQLMENSSTCIPFDELNKTCCGWKTDCIQLLKNLDVQSCTKRTTTTTAAETSTIDCTSPTLMATRGATNACPCRDLPRKMQLTMDRCVDYLRENPPSLVELGDASSEAEGKPKYHAELYTYSYIYPGPVVNLLTFGPIALILPRYRIKSLKITDIDASSADIFIRLPEPKKLAITNQTLTVLSDRDREMQIRTYFQSKGCGFLPGVETDLLNTPGILTRQLAMDMCACSEGVSQNNPAKVNVLCDTIYVKTNDFADFKSIFENLCPACLNNILGKEPSWRDQLLADSDLRPMACDKIGSSFILPPAVLSEWDSRCNEPSQVSACGGVRIALLPYQSSRQTSSNLAMCKAVLCERLCSLTRPVLDTIRRILRTSFTDDVGCLAYLDGVHRSLTDRSQVDAATIKGSCALKSRVIKESRDPMTVRKRRQTANINCDDIRNDISYGINPSDVLDVTVITEQVESEDFLECVRETELGDYQWDQEQARALYELILKSGSFDAIENWSSNDLGILGYIGLAFSPEELDQLNGLTQSIYATFGAAYGWSPQQLRALAQRYLRDNNIVPAQLTGLHLAILNHLVCGLTREQVRAIPLLAIRNVTTIMGMMRQCEIEVIQVLTDRIEALHGPPRYWSEAQFSEYGILLAGLSGEDLRNVGPKLADHITVPVINHIPPAEFRKLKPEQTRLFDYEVALAIRSRGLCAWLSEEHRGQGYVQQTCAGSGATSHLKGPAMAVVVFVLVFLLPKTLFTIP